MIEKMCIFGTLRMWFIHSVKNTKNVDIRQLALSRSSFPEKMFIAFKFSSLDDR